MMVDDLDSGERWWREAVSGEQWRTTAANSGGQQ